MDISEIRIVPAQHVEPEERVRAFGSVTFDHRFVVHDLKVIEGNKGLFVAMPSRKLADRCPRCRAKNHLRAKFCNDCGARLAAERGVPGEDGRVRLHADIAHPATGCVPTVRAEACPGRVRTQETPDARKAWNQSPGSHALRRADGSRQIW